MIASEPFLFTVVPGTALAVAILFSLYEVYRIGETRLAVVLVVLGFMFVHQTNEALRLLEQGSYAQSTAGELPETGANLVAAASVYYVLGFTRRERRLRDDVEASRARLRETTERLNRIFENVNDGILLIDLEAERIVEANPRACEILRYPESELLGRSPYDIHPHDAVRFEAMTERVSTDGGFVTEELSCRRRDGTTMPAAVSVSGSTVEVDGNEAMLVSIQDNTRRHRYRTQIGLLGRVLRHDIKNDINVVIGHLGLIEAETDDPAIADRAREATEQCKELDSLATRSRRLNELIESERDSATTTTDLAPLAERTVAGFESEFPDARIETEIPDTVPVAADRTIEWAIEELVENALLHAERADPRVRVSVERETAVENDIRTEWVTLTVADDGPRIPEMELNVVFGETTRTQVEHGTGLGLWVVSQLADLFEGDIVVEQPSAGPFSTLVSIRLPPADA